MCIFLLYERFLLVNIRDGIYMMIYAKNISVMCMYQSAGRGTKV